MLMKIITLLICNIFDYYDFRRTWEAKKALHLEDEVAEEDLEVASEEAFLEVAVVSVVAEVC